MAKRHDRRTPPAAPARGSREDSEARLRAIVNTVIDGIITIDERGRIESFNPAAERIFGYKVRAVLGRNVSMLMPSPHQEAHDGYIRNYMRTGVARIIGIGREVVGRRKDGSTFPLDLAVTEVKVRGRRIFTGVVRDVTERKKAEEAITSASERERERFGQELHDSLGQQLTGLALLAKTLEKKLFARGDATSLDAAGISMLASRALDDVKLQAHGLYPIELERHGFGAALRELAHIQQTLFKVVCTYDGPDELPSLKTHEALHLYRIAQEAVNNAVKHGRAKRIRIRLESGAPALKLSVEDDGCGLPARAGEKGGMGLSIMRYRAGVLGAKMEYRRGARRGT
ncbi:MAG TPA: PAS domain S-box protein, partial [Kiritimatiellia bacterium]